MSKPKKPKVKSVKAKKRMVCVNDLSDRMFVGHSRRRLVLGIWGDRQFNFTTQETASLVKFFCDRGITPLPRGRGR